MTMFDLTRRDVLKQATAAAAASVAAAGPWSAAWAQSQPAAHEPLFRISLAEWSFHRALYAKKMDHLEFAALAAKEFGLLGCEYVNTFFKDKAGDAAYISQMKKRASDNGVRSVLIMCDGEGALGDADEQKRRQAVENHYKWADAAKELGCHSIRVNAQSSGSYEEQRDRAADGLRKLVEYVAKLDLNLIVENHGGLSSNGKWLTETIRKADHPRLGTLPDFGNFHVSSSEEYDRYKGIEEMMPFARGVSAKSHDFDAQGNETGADYRRMMKIVLAAGYHGFVGIEYEGDRLSEAEGVRATKRLLETVRDELSRR